MSCAARRDLITLYAMGALERDEHQSIAAHLATGCRECAAALAEDEMTAAQIPFALEPIEPPAELKARLMEQISRAPQSIELARVRRARGRDWWSPALAAAAAALLVFLPMWREQQALQGLVAKQSGRIAEQRQRIDQLQAEYDHSRKVERLLASNRTTIVPIGGTAAQPQAAANLLWDRNENRWHLYVASMKPAPQGRTYELWFITADQRKVPAGTFDVDADGRAVYEIAVPAGLGSIVMAAVTDEPPGGSEQPTGSIQAAGAIPG